MYGGGARFAAASGYTERDKDIADPEADPADGPQRENENRVNPRRGIPGRDVTNGEQAQRSRTSCGREGRARPGTIARSCSSATGRTTLEQAERNLADRTAELAEALAYTDAISQVLRVISELSTDVAPVLETIMDCATRLLRPQTVGIFRYDGDLIHLAAHRNWTPDVVEQASATSPMPADERSNARNPDRLVLYLNHGHSIRH